MLLKFIHRLAKIAILSHGFDYEVHTSEPISHAIIRWIATWFQFFHFLSFRASFSNCCVSIVSDKGTFSIIRRALACL